MMEIYWLRVFGCCFSHDWMAAGKQNLPPEPSCKKTASAGARHSLNLARRPFASGTCVLIGHGSGLGSQTTFVMAQLTDMREDIQWQGATVEIRARLVPRCFWTTAAMEVFVDGQRVLQTDGRMKFSGSKTANFLHAGSKHWTELSWGHGWLRSFPYSLRLDGSPVSEGRVNVRNWPLGFTTPFLIAAVVLWMHYFMQHAQKN